MAAVQRGQGMRRPDWWAWLAHEGVLGDLGQCQSLRRIL